MRGRDREAQAIRRAHMAVAMGRLMDGQLNDWRAFDRAQDDDYEALDRRRLKSGYADVKTRLRGDVSAFCKRNFKGLSESHLCDLYAEVREHHGLVLPRHEFETKYAPIRPDACKGAPAHATVHIGLWGLQFQFPEDCLQKDIVTALDLLESAQEGLDAHQDRTLRDVKADPAQVRAELSRVDFAARSCIVACFNLVETYLNGLAWWVANCNQPSEETLSSVEKLNAKGTLRKKLLQYPQLAAGRPVKLEDDPDAAALLGRAKQLRDSLVHASPFPAPAKWGGYDKLERLYSLDASDARETAQCAARLLTRIQRDVYGPNSTPVWLQEFAERVGTEAVRNVP